MVTTTPLDPVNLRNLRRDLFCSFAQRNGTSWTPRYTYPPAPSPLAFHPLDGTEEVKRDLCRNDVAHVLRVPPVEPLEGDPHDPALVVEARPAGVPRVDGGVDLYNQEPARRRARRLEAVVAAIHPGRYPLGDADGPPSGGEAHHVDWALEEGGTARGPLYRHDPLPEGIHLGRIVGGDLQYGQVDVWSLAHHRGPPPAGLAVLADSDVGGILNDVKVREDPPPAAAPIRVGTSVSKIVGDDEAGASAGSLPGLLPGAEVLRLDVADLEEDDGSEAAGQVRGEVAAVVDVVVGVVDVDAGVCVGAALVDIIVLDARSRGRVGAGAGLGLRRGAGHCRAAGAEEVPTAGGRGTGWGGREGEGEGEGEGGAAD